MLSKRGGRTLRPFAAIVAGVVMALAIPMTSVFADDHEGSHSGAPKHAAAPKLLTTFVVNSVACTAAINQLKADLATDKTEDIQERQAEKAAEGTPEVKEVELDQTADAAEKLTLKTDRANVETACEPQEVTTPACTAAQTALKAANTADKTEDKTERSTTEKPDSGPDTAQNKTEDTQENAALKTLRMAVQTACGELERD